MYIKRSDFMPFDSKVYLSSPTMHGEEIKYIEEAYNTNWMSTIGENINKVEEGLAQFLGAGYTVALSAGTAALHLAIRLAGTKLYGHPKTSHGTLEGHKVFCSDVTFDATVNPVTYEGGIPVFIDTEEETWNMDPKSLRKAFELYPDVKLIVVAHLYGTPGKIGEIREIADEHGALIVEDAAESLSATYKGRQTGTFGDFSIISFNGNKLITGSSGGMFITNSKEDADTVRKWSTQSREPAPWYQHEDLGFNYRMSNVVAGVVRGQIPYIKEHAGQKKQIYLRYKEAFKDIPVTMNPYDEENSEPNFWLSCITVNEEAMCKQERDDLTYTYVSENGKSCPQEILNAISDLNAEGRPVWKPMHMQPIFKDSPFVSASGKDVGADLFRRGLCLPSDNKMTPEIQDRIIKAVKSCFE